MRSPYGFSETIAKAASRARGDRLGKYYLICEGQKTISTKRLERILDELQESDRLDAVHFKSLADQLNRKDREITHD